MADWSDIQVAHNALNNPFTSGADLSAIAQTQPSLWPGVAAHPNAFPELLSQLGQFGDPAVQAALASRGATAQSGTGNYDLTQSVVPRLLPTARVWSPQRVSLWDDR